VKRVLDQSLYELLEVAPDATILEIEKAYERAKALYGPGSLATYTLVAPEDAALLAQRLEEARAVLTDPVARVAYNSRLGIGQAPAEKPLEAEPAKPNAPVDPPPADTAPSAATPPPPRSPIEEPRAAAPPDRPAIPEVPPKPEPVRTPSQPLAPVPPPREIPIPDDAVWTGEMLRKVREAKGITLQQVAEKTRVGKRHLECIEGEKYAELPVAVYLRGILMSIAKELRLDGQKVARSYMERLAKAAPAPPKR
jgi:curved DNA-binding protein CbpA